MTKYLFILYLLSSGNCYGDRKMAELGKHGESVCNGDTVLTSVSLCQPGSAPAGSRATLRMTAKAIRKVKKKEEKEA